MLVYIIIGLAIIILFLVMLFSFLIKRNKINKEKIKFIEAQAQISLLLNKKKLLLSDIKDELGDYKSILDGIENVDEYVEDDFDYNDKLAEYYKRFFKLINSDEFIDNHIKSDEFDKLFSLIKEEEEALSGCIKYHNAKAEAYNSIISTFFGKIVCLISGDKKTKYYSNEKVELFNILK